jgi:hypothetical protein
MRIKTQVKAIADAHIEARSTGKFDNPKVTTKEEVINALLEGKTFEGVMEQIEFRYCSITSILLNSRFQHSSNSYRSSIYKGFKFLLNDKVN